MSAANGDLPDQRTGQRHPRGPAGPSSARRWLLAGAVIALLAGMAGQVMRNPDEVEYFRRLSASILALTLLVQVLSQLLYNSALLLPLRMHMKELGYWEFFIVRTGGFLLGHVVPVAGGIAVRLAYLRGRGLNYRDFAWATLLSNVAALLASAALAVVATGILWLVVAPPPALVLGLSASVLVLSITVLWLFQSLPDLAGHSWFHRWPWISRLRGFTASRQTMMHVFALSLARHGLNFVTFGLLYRSLSQSAGGFLTGGLVYALTSPLKMVQITPGNLGINEWVSAIVGTILSFDVTTGLIVALMFRGLSLLAQGLGVLFGWVWLAGWRRP